GGGVVWGIEEHGAASAGEPALSALGGRGVRRGRGGPDADPAEQQLGRGGRAGGLPGGPRSAAWGREARLEGVLRGRPPCSFPHVLAPRSAGSTSLAGANGPDLSPLVVDRAPGQAATRTFMWLFQGCLSGRGLDGHGPTSAASGCRPRAGQPF